MSKHDPKVTLRQIADHALRAQELCAQNDLPAILTDWHKLFRVFGVFRGCHPEYSLNIVRHWWPGF